jgi:hypothetical protein
MVLASFHCFEKSLVHLLKLGFHLFFAELSEFFVYSAYLILAGHVICIYFLLFPGVIFFFHFLDDIICRAGLLNFDEVPFAHRLSLLVLLMSV